MIRWHRFPSARTGRTGWYAEIDGKMVAEAHKTGTHLDDYPWEWYLLDAAERVDGRRGSAVEDSLRACKNSVAFALGQEERF